MGRGSINLDMLQGMDYAREQRRQKRKPRKGSRRPATGSNRPALSQDAQEEDRPAAYQETRSGGSQSQYETSAAASLFNPSANLRGRAKPTLLTGGGYI